MDERIREELARAALEAQRHAYAKYSNFPVGAALLTPSGTIFTGVNVENASFGLTLCAERVAAASAVAAGEREFVALAVASRTGVPPCGACRQFLAEFHPALPIVLVDSLRPETIRETTLAELLPGPFEGPV